MIARLSIGPDRINIAMFFALAAWGYTVGAAAERYQGSWALRLGVFDLSDVPNSEHLEPGFHEFPSIVELEKRYAIAQRSGKVMAKLFDTRGRMGLLEQALEVARNDAAAVDIAAVRGYRSRLGADLNIEQALTDDLGAFARFGKSAGNVEAYEFTDIDRTFSLGLSLKGSHWRRGGDTVAVAAIVMRSRRPASSTWRRAALESWSGTGSCCMKVRRKSSRPTTRRPFSHSRTSPSTINGSKTRPTTLTGARCLSSPYGFMSIGKNLILNNQ
ncbi:MAG TPA: carbohydrate porin [Steroidobacteraceae bacterium]